MQFLGALNGLRAPAGVELRQNARDVGLDGACRDEEAVRDLLIRKSLSDQLENLVFAFADSECAEIRFVELKWNARLDNLRPGQTQTGPDSKRGEHYGNRPNIEFERYVPNEILVLNELQEPDKYSHRDRVYENGSAHGKKTKAIKPEV